MTTIPELARRSGPGPACWSARSGEVEARFLGRDLPADRDRALATSEDRPPPAAWLRQIHSADLVMANAGLCGPGDALWTSRTRLALSVATADCVPVLLAGGGSHVAAIHAGWRGIVAGVIPATLSALGAAGSSASAVGGWIGPSIGPCCYEVGEDVAEAVVRASGGGVASAGPAGRPHLDLQAAVARQLRDAGVALLGHVAECTRCSPRLLWSYRRDGDAAGRNLAFVWRRSIPRPTS